VSAEWRRGGGRGRLPWNWRKEGGVADFRRNREQTAAVVDVCRIESRLRLWPTSAESRAGCGCGRHPPNREQAAAVADIRRIESRLGLWSMSAESRASCGCGRCRPKGEQGGGRGEDSANRGGVAVGWRRGQSKA